MATLELVHAAPAETRGPPRPDHRTIAIMAHERARALVVGCGDGRLIEHMRREKNIRAHGLEQNRTLAHACVLRGLSVLQCDPEEDLAAFPADAFDYVIFPRTLQTMRRPAAALREARRIGERVLVSAPNAAHWRARMRLLLKGRMPGADGEAMHGWSVRDFAALAREAKLSIERATPLSHGRPGAPFAKQFWRANWFAEEAVFLLTR